MSQQQKHKSKSTISSLFFTYGKSNAKWRNFVQLWQQWRMCTVHSIQLVRNRECAISSRGCPRAGPCTYRVEWFLRGENGHLPSCGKLLLDPIYKLLPFKVAYFWGARPHKILPVTLKSATQNIIFNIIKGCTWSKMCSLVCLKAKTFLKILAFTMLLILGNENIF